jgi:hypothetical protein
MDTSVLGMAVTSTTLYYCTFDDGLKMLNLSDNSVSNFITGKCLFLQCHQSQTDAQHKSPAIHKMLISIDPLFINCKGTNIFL